MLKFTFRQQVSAGFIFSVMLVLVVGSISYYNTRHSQEETVWVDHSQEVIKTSEHLLQLLTDAETGIRGYAATGDKLFLAPYYQALPDINIELDHIKELVKDNPVQVSRIDSLSHQIGLELNILKENIDTRENKGLAYMISNGAFLNGKNSMDAIRSTQNKINIDETELLNTRAAVSNSASAQVTYITIIGSVVFVIIILVLFFYIQKTFARQKQIEADILHSNNELAGVLKENEFKNWLLTGTAKLNELIQGEQNETELAKRIIKEACIYSNAQIGTFYLYNETENTLNYKADFAFHNPAAIKHTLPITDGWLGLALEDKEAKILRGKLNEDLSLESSLLREQIFEAVIVPFYFNRKLKGVFEIGFNTGIDEKAETYIKAIGNVVGIAINTAQSRSIMRDLIEETQQQAEELEAQQEEMRVTNEELMHKTQMLQASEEELRVQQEELRTTNAELEEKASLLEGKNHVIEVARKSIDLKMRELEATGKYKSEFLANMSHELRTPLNSILVLARILKDNKPENLTEDQIKYASVIFNAGNDLLTLINDILDLSKIESGKLELQNEKVAINDIVKDCEMLFAEIANSKNITYTAAKDDNLPQFMVTDKTRTEQIIKNLLSNAFKFTPANGSVALQVKLADRGRKLAFVVKDTGIGIATDKQKVIFEAFQQADGSTSRKYGGTGLGLSISRELANLLGGNITLKSTPGEGSEFTLVLPIEAKIVKPAPIENIDFDNALLNDTLKPLVQENNLVKTPRSGGQPLVIIVEDDKNFASILQDYAKEHGYKSALIHEGTGAFQIIKDTQPDAVILDIMLPGKDGWQILKELKNDAETTHIPVHLMSAGDAAANKVRNSGAISFLKKPIDTDILNKLFTQLAGKNGTGFNRILLIEDQKLQSLVLKEMMEKQGIVVEQAFDGASALRMLAEQEYQCVILDIDLPDISGLDMLDKIKEDEHLAQLPVIINTAMQLDKASVNRLMQYANAMVIKNSKSGERLIDEVNLFLNKVHSKTDGVAKSNSASFKSPDFNGEKGVLKNKKILIADDDMRNIFALSSALQTYDMQVEIANDGEEALKKLADIADIDMVLMDIMMPKMDGYEAMRQIRANTRFNKLPVIALTAKAMKEDREKCIQAGANDYITKPVDIDRLLALMQIWLRQ